MSGILPTSKYSSFTFSCKYFDFMLQGFGNQESGQSPRSFETFSSLGSDNCSSSAGPKYSSTRGLKSTDLSNRVRIPAVWKQMTKSTVCMCQSIIDYGEQLNPASCGLLTCINSIAILGSFSIYTKFVMEWSNRVKSNQTGEGIGNMDKV